MKKIYLYAILFIAGLFLFVQFFGNGEENRSEYSGEPFQEYKALKSKISAHRGGKDVKGYAENCLLTIQYLHDKYPGMSFEIDLQNTADGRIVLFHDDGMDRLTGRSGKVEDFSYETLSEIPLLDSRKNETDCRIPLLDDVLAWAVEADATLWLDFKEDISYEKVIAMVREYKAEDNVILISYTVAQARKLQSLAPEMIVSATARNMKEWGWLQEAGLNFKKVVVFTGTKLSDKEVLNAIHSENALTVLGTLGNLDKRAEARGDHLYREWLDDGYDLFSTDRPEEMWKALYGK